MRRRTSSSPLRLLIVSDGAHYFVRHVAAIIHDLETDEKIYRCDAHVAGPYNTVDGASAYVRFATECQTRRCSRCRARGRACARCRARLAASAPPVRDASELH